MFLSTSLALSAIACVALADDSKEKSNDPWDRLGYSPDESNVNMPQQIFMAIAGEESNKWSFTWITNSTECSDSNVVMWKCNDDNCNEPQNIFGDNMLQGQQQLNAEDMRTQLNANKDKNGLVVAYGDDAFTYQRIEKDNGAWGEHDQNYTSGAIHKVVTPVLEPNTKYGYLLFSFNCAFNDISDSKDLFKNTKSGSFKTLHHVSEGNPDQPMKFGVMGDVGQTESSWYTYNTMSKHENLDAILWTGDLSYADGLQTRWDYWGRMVANISETLPIHFCGGNHETEEQNTNCTVKENGFPNGVNGINGGDCFNGVTYHQAINARFRMPFQESGANMGNAYHSYNAGPVHVVNLNTYVTPSEVYKQAVWFENDVKKVDRKTTPWLIVLIHAPWYNSNKYHQSSYEPTYWSQNVFEDLFLQYNVDVVLNGHVHSYERIHPTVRNERNDTHGIPYLVVGAGGNHEGPAYSFVEYPRDYSAVRLNGFGHGVLELLNSSTFQWTYMDSENGTVLDTYQYTARRW